MQSAMETRLQSSQQQVSSLQANLAKAELQLENAAAAKTKLPFFPMSPLAGPPVRHDPTPPVRMDSDKENVGTEPAQRRSKSPTQVRT